MWIKLCGMTREPDVQAAVEAGADAVGVVLVPTSPRYVDALRARELARLARALRPAVRVVGVFTQPDPREVVHAARIAEVDLVQLHGGQDEAARDAIEQAGFPCIRTVWPPQGSQARSSAGPSAAPRHVAPENPPGPEGPSDPEELPAATEGRPPWAYLLDRRTDRMPGGTGLQHDAARAARWARVLSARAPVILAGGLRPDNVVGFLRAVQPWGVDASSGVERPGKPGVKDPAALRAFVQAVRAWEEEHERGDSHTVDGRLRAALPPGGGGR